MLKNFWVFYISTRSITMFHTVKIFSAAIFNNLTWIMYECKKTKQNLQYQVQQKVFMQFFSNIENYTCCFWMNVFSALLLQELILNSSICCQIQEDHHSSRWNVKFHLVQLLMRRGCRHKILVAPLWFPQHLKTLKPLEMVEPDASLTFFSGGPGAKPAAMSTRLTVLRDIQTGFLCWHRVWKHSRRCCLPLSSPLSPSGAAKQVSKKDPLGCVSSKKNKQMICV